MSAAIYARQSFDRDGTGTAVERQLVECRALADKLHVGLPREFIDNDVSATTGVRPEFTKLLQHVETGDIDRIIVWHTDRLYRRVRDLIEIVDMAERHSVIIHTVRAGDLDLSTPSGRLVAGMLGHAARFEIEQKSARMKFANEQRARNGGWPFALRPYGYKRRKGQIKIVKEEAAALRDMYDMYINGRSYETIAAEMNARGVLTITGKQWRPDNVLSRLANPAYAGISMYLGKPAGIGKWEPIISRETRAKFEAARALRGFDYRWTRRTEYLLSGIARCGVCGSRLLGQYLINKPLNDGTVKRRQVYVCKPHVCVTRSLPLVESEVLRRLFDHIEETDGTARSVFRIDVDPLIQQAQQLRAERKRIRAQIERGFVIGTDAAGDLSRLSRQLNQTNWLITSSIGEWNAREWTSTGDLRSKWDSLPIQRQRALINSEMTITINRQSNRKVFDPEDIVTSWK